MPRPLRYTLALILLAISLVVLAWAFWPHQRVIRRQLIQPTEIELPNSGGSLPMQREFAWTHQFVETAGLPIVAARFALII